MVFHEIINDGIVEPTSVILCCNSENAVHYLRWNSQIYGCLVWNLIKLVIVFQNFKKSDSNIDEFDSKSHDLDTILVSDTWIWSNLSVISKDISQFE